MTDKHGLAAARDRHEQATDEGVPSAILWRCGCGSWKWELLYVDSIRCAHCLKPCIRKHYDAEEAKHG